MERADAVCAAVRMAWGRLYWLVLLGTYREFWDNVRLRHDMRTGRPGYYISAAALIALYIKTQRALHHWNEIHN